LFAAALLALPREAVPAQEARADVRAYHLRVFTFPDLDAAAAARDDIARFRPPAGQGPVTPRRLGGYVGRIDLGKLRPEVVAAIRALGVGETSPILWTEKGYLIVQRTTDAHFREGAGLLRRRRFARALAPLRKDLALNPDNLSGWLALGEALGELGRRGQAEDAYRRAIGVAAGDPAAYNNLATYYLRWDRPREAERLLREGLRHAPESALLRENLARMEKLRDGPGANPGRGGAKLAQGTPRRGREDVLSSEPSPGGSSPGEDVLTSHPPKGDADRPGPPPPPAPAPRAAMGGIQVLNGNGARGNATLWAGRMRAKDLPVLRPGNAQRMDHKETVIYYRDGFEKLALRVRGVLGRRGRLVPLRGEGPAAVRVILGRDLLRPKGRAPGNP